MSMKDLTQKASSGKSVTMQESNAPLNLQLVAFASCEYFYSHFLCKELLRHL